MPRTEKTISKGFRCLKAEKDRLVTTTSSSGQVSGIQNRNYKRKHPQLFNLSCMKFLGEPTASPDSKALKARNVLLIANINHIS